MLQKYFNFPMIKKSVTFTIVLFLSFEISLAQTFQSPKKIDSLYKLVTLKRDSAQFDLRILLMRENLKLNSIASIDESLKLADNARDISYSMADSLRIVKAHYAIGYIMRKKNQSNEAITDLLLARGIAERNKFDDELIKILNTLAIAYTFNGNQDKALECHFKALLIHEKRGSKEDLAITYNNIGFIYFKLKDYQVALDFYDKSLKTNILINNSYDLDGLMINIALCYNQLGKFMDAEKFVRKALSICGNECRPLILMEAEFCLGVSLFEQLRLEEASGHFNRSLRLSRQQNEKRFQIENLRYLALLKEERGFNSAALDLLHEAEAIAVATEYTLTLIDLYKAFSRVYSDQNDFKNTVQYQAKYIQLKDSIYSEDLIKNLAKVQTNYAERENIKTIKEKDEILLLKQQLIDRQRVQYFYIALVAILALGFAVVLLFDSRRQRKSRAEIGLAKEKIEEQNNLLEEQNKALEHRVKNRTMELSKSNLLLSEVNAELDNFLYKTSHDIRGPIATMKGLCNLGLIDSKDPVVTSLMHQMVGQSDRMSKIVGRLTTISDINHTILRPEKIDFLALLDWVLANEEEKARSKNIQISFEVAEGLQIVSDELMIRTILENLVNNGIKFYNDSVRLDSFVKVQVSQNDSIVNIRVIDNGIGIGADEAKADGMFHIFTRASERSETGGVGLYLSKLCSHKIGGQIRIEKSDDDGTIFLIQLPVDLAAVLEKRKLLQEDMQRILEEENTQKAKLVSFT
jgi:signal transduction histidine kinase/tetratricopeptide (TPR) repeat protein